MGKGGWTMTPMSVFRRRMEISFASFLRLIRRETEPRGRCRFVDFGKGKYRKGATTVGEGGDAEDAARAASSKGRRGGERRAAGGFRGMEERGQDWEAKCRRPNNGQAASTDLPAPGPHEASTCFPSAARISDLQFAHCGSLTRLSSASCP